MQRPPAAASLALAILVSSCGSALPEQRPAFAWTAEAAREAELLLERANCIACHAADEQAAARLGPRDVPDLSAVGARVTPSYLRAYLSDIQGTKPGARMPDALSGVAPEARGVAVEALVHYLVARGGPLESAPTVVDPGAIERGRELFHEVGCVACHEPREEPWQLDYFHWTLEGEDPPLPPTGDEDAPTAATPDAWTVTPLGDLRRKTTVDALAQFLLDPLAARPSGRMPSLALEPSEALDIARYLLRDPQTDRVEPLPGLAFEEFLDEFGHGDPQFEALEPATRGVLTQPDAYEPSREDHVGVRMHGFVEVVQAGVHEFFTTSDDGSRLWVDGELLVDNWGLHGQRTESGSRWLDTGPHALRIEWFEAGGDAMLEVEWEGPDFARGPLAPERLSHRAVVLRPTTAEPFEFDAERAALGERLFKTQGCASCHEPELDEAPAAHALADVRAFCGRGCLREGSVGAPNYAHDERERELMRQALVRADELSRPLEGEEFVQRTLERFSCLACHARGGRGGPARERMPHFLTAGEADLGDEGRIPPSLDGVGGKLRADWIPEVLYEHGRARPYMLTRMPDFQREHLGQLAELLSEIDPPLHGDREPEFGETAIADGQTLAGTGGLGCIQCHTFAGHDSLGIPATDLADVHRRIRPGWFRELLMDPVALGMNSRMPQFWNPGEGSPVDVLGGDPSSQIDALWSYLSLGEAAPLPEGLIVRDEEFELVPLEEPELVGVFMEGLSPRVIAVGHPERTHVAFDVQNSRLAKAWRGRFFNARGTWFDRAGKLENPPSDDVFELPAGAPFAVLETPQAPWPPAAGADAGYRSLGRRFDEQRRPVFRYAFAEVEIEESAVPLLRPGASWIRRSFGLRTQVPVPGLHLRVARLRAQTSDVRLQADTEITWIGDFGCGLPDGSILVPDGDWLEVRAPVRFEQEGDAFVARMEIEFTW